MLCIQKTFIDCTGKKKKFQGCTIFFQNKKKFFLFKTALSDTEKVNKNDTVGDSSMFTYAQL